MKLIDKDALVADIEKLENTYKKCPTRNIYEDGLKDGRLIGYKDALYKIDTLEVKEVDLDWQDIYSILYIERIVMREFGDKEYSNEELCLEVLKRFKAQKGESV